MGETTTRSELFEALTITRSDYTFLAPKALASSRNIELTNEDPPRALRLLLSLREGIEVGANCVVEQWPKKTRAFYLCE
jgi:hypothetical protein